jgi:hypothetical protein
MGSMGASGAPESPYPCFLTHANQSHLIVQPGTTFTLSDLAASWRWSRPNPTLPRGSPWGWMRQTSDPVAD